MSDRHDTTDRENAGALGLLERAGELSPPMAVHPESVLAAGRQKVRRRRTSAVGAGAAALALAGTLWVAGPMSPFTDTETVAPATISWHNGVDVDLFDNEPNPTHEAGRTHWTGELRSGEGDALPELVLTKDGTELDPIPAEDGPGDVMVFRTEGLSVAAWQRPVGSIGEAPVWSPGSNFGQGSSIEVGDGKLNYAVAEFVPGASGELEELYWFSEDAGHAASGAEVSSAVLSAGDARVVVLVDEERGTWGTVQAEAPVDNFVHLESLKSDSGVTGWAGPEVVSVAVGVLPQGASLSESSDGVTQVHATVGARMAVLASDPTAATVPPIQFTIDGSAQNLFDYATSTQTITVGTTSVGMDAMPDGLQLFVGPGEFAVISNEDFEGGRAVVGAIGGGHIVVVPGWEPEAEAADLRVQSAGEWLPVDSALATTQFNGTPLMVLGLNASTLADGTTVDGIGVVEGDTVVPHEPEGGLSVLDLDL